MTCVRCLKLVCLVVMAVGMAESQKNSAVPPGCTAAAAKYPGASVACDNAALVSDLLRRGWNAKASEELQSALKKSATTPGVYGAAVAFTPAALSKYGITKASLFSPYCSGPTDASKASSAANIKCMDIGDTKSGGYNYMDAKLPQTKWYTQIASAGANAKPSWSGVYFDKGGGEIWMDTLSVPVLGPDGKLAAVATADVRAKEPAKSGSSASSGR